MKHKAWIAVLLAFGAACDDRGDPALVGTSGATVRFVNVVPGASGNILLTANGSVVGSAQTFGSFSATCAAVPAGSNRTLAFGTAATTGSGLASTLATTSASFTSGGSYTVVALGTVAAPRLLVLNNTPASTATTGNANIRFVNGTDQAIDFYTSSGTTLSTPTFAGVAANTAASGGSFAMVPITNGVLSFRAAGGTANLFTTSISGTNTFQTGQNYTVVLFPNLTGTGLQAVTFQGC